MKVLVPLSLHLQIHKDQSQCFIVSILNILQVSPFEVLNVFNLEEEVEVQLSLVEEEVVGEVMQWEVGEAVVYSLLVEVELALQVVRGSEAL